MDFKNTLIILTSNVGSSVIEKGGGGIGFQVRRQQSVVMDGAGTRMPAQACKAGALRTSE